MSLYDSLMEMVLDESNKKSVDDMVKKDEAKIKAEINKQVKVFFDQEKDNYKESSGYDWRRTIKKVPTVDRFDYESPNFPFIFLSYSGPGKIPHDHIIFFEDDFVRYLKNQHSSILNKYYFYNEDYPGIICQLKIH